MLKVERGRPSDRPAPRFPSDAQEASHPGTPRPSPTSVSPLSCAETTAGHGALARRGQGSSRPKKGEGDGHRHWAPEHVRGHLRVGPSRKTRAFSQFQLAALNMRPPIKIKLFTTPPPQPRSLAVICVRSGFRGTNALASHQDVQARHCLSPRGRRPRARCVAPHQPGARRARYVRAQRQHRAGTRLLRHGDGDSWLAARRQRHG